MSEKFKKTFLISKKS